MTLLAEPPKIVACPTSLIPVEEMSPAEWFVCSTWAGYESRMAEYLIRHRAHFFLPMQKKRRLKEDGHGRKYWVESEKARFPRYIFLNGDEAREKAMTHSYRSVNEKCTIWPVPGRASVKLHDELVQISKAIELNPYLTTSTGVKVGRRVRVVRGPWMGREGIIEKIDERRFTVNLNCKLMNRHIPLEEMPIEFVEEIEDAGAA